MRIILFLMLVSTFCFGQYGNNIVPNGGFESYTGTKGDQITDTFTNWTHQNVLDGYIDASDTLKFGSAGINIKPATSGATRTENNAVPASASTEYRFSIWHQEINTNVGKARIKNAAGSSDYFFANIEPASVGSMARFTSTFTTSAGETAIQVKLGLVQGAQYRLFYDDFQVAEKLDTLWVSPSGSDTDNDTTLTLTEAFMVRGAHSGGYFITQAGTYSESITIDSSFTRWEASGGNVTITQVDFNNVAVTCDNCIYQGIGTKLNTANVTVDYSNCSAPGLDNKFNKWTKWKEW